jgi:hypothetical protein
VTADERAGRRITIGIAWLAGAPPVILLCALAFAGYPIPKVLFVMRGVVPVVMAWLLVRGRRWVRMLIVLGFGVNAVSSLVRLLQMDWTLTTMLLLNTEVVVHGLAAVVLAASPQVRAFFAYQNRMAVLDLSSDRRPV